MYVCTVRMFGRILGILGLASVLDWCGRSFPVCFTQFGVQAIGTLLSYHRKGTSTRFVRQLREPQPAASTGTIGILIKSHLKIHEPSTDLFFFFDAPRLGLAFR
jgi:hypothetical protein